MENACELHTVLLAEYGGLACCCLRVVLALRRHHSRMSLQVSIRQTLVLQLECVVENACELHTVLLAEYMVAWHAVVCMSFVVAKAPFQDESSSFHSADPSAPVGVRCGKRL